MRDTDPSIYAADPRWFVVHSAPRKEEFACANLENQGYHVFLPMLRRTVRHARRSRDVRRALFPRYLFVELDLARQGWRSITGTYGVTCCLTDGTRPLPAPRGLVETMMARADQEGVVDLSATLTPGQTVGVLHGPFAGQIGCLTSLGEAGRARVLLQILGAEREITLSAEGLSPA